jgi:hypothetical protein
VCASRLIEPNDMAPVENRLTISAPARPRRSGLFGSLDLEQPADRIHPQGGGVDHVGEFPVTVLCVAADGVLQRGHNIRRPGMVFSAHAVDIFAAHFQRSRKHRIVAEKAGS